MKGLLLIENNPVYILEKYRQKRKKFTLPPWLGYIAVLSIPGIMVTLLLPYGYGDGAYGYELNLLFVAMFLAQNILFGYRAIAETHAVFTSEKENRTFLSLISTLMTPEEILTGKLWNCIKTPILELIIFSPFFYWNGMICSIPADRILVFFLLTFFLILSFSLLGLYFSLIFPDSRQSWSQSLMVFTGFLLVSHTLLFLGMPQQVCPIELNNKIKAFFEQLYYTSPYMIILFLASGGWRLWLKARNTISLIPK